AVACTMFSRDNQTVPFAVKDGLQVKLRGRAGLYETRGTYQLTVQQMEDAGQGNLQEQFEKLKAKLAAEGLFDSDRKKQIPMLPRKIGIITSPTGAAVRDIIHVLNRRRPNLEILLAPVTVQGSTAAGSIARAISYFNTRNDIEIMIVGRGGGSLEDLWAFNEEIVARAIAESRIPVISAVGHEIDFTIADFVADLRAPTPSAAAELAVPVQSELETQIDRLAARLSGSLQNRALILRERIPGIQQKLTQTLRTSLQQRQQRTDEAALRLSHELKNSVVGQKQRLPHLQQSMQHTLHVTINEKAQRIKRLEAQLRALSPLGVLKRGYSITETADGTVVRDAATIKKGDTLKTRFENGTLLSEVTTTNQ
ncbi:MAG: exodeoxyribonuclease VII large subunit, partial [Kiritimatiellaceae bacterium]|nr:exodeoxyribonuclease VII large subunit [Kiritimatiellaceae bacterium]